MTDPGSDYLRSGATIGMTHELDNKIHSLYPEMSPSGVTRANFLSGEVAHVSVRIPHDWRNNTEFHGNLICLLEAAKNPEHPAFSEHGYSRHETFDEAIDTLIKNVRDNKFNLELVPFRKHVGNRKREVMATRIILQPIEAIERVTYKPLPKKTAEELVETDRDERVRSKKLRQIAKEKGTAFALLTLAYIKPNEKDIFDFFTNKDFKKDLESLGYKVPTLSRGSDKAMMSSICNILVIKKANEVIASPLPDKYRQILEILRMNGYITENDKREDKFGFHEVTDIVLPKAVFVGTDEVAQQLAPEGLDDPKRTEYIMTNYGYGLTSILATSFIEQL